MGFNVATCWVHRSSHSVAATISVTTTATIAWTKQLQHHVTNNDNDTSNSPYNTSPRTVCTSQQIFCLTQDFLPHLQRVSPLHVYMTTSTCRDVFRDNPSPSIAHHHHHHHQHHPHPHPDPHTQVNQQFDMTHDYTLRDDGISATSCKRRFMPSQLPALSNTIYTEQTRNFHSKWHFNSDYPHSAGLHTSLREMTEPVFLTSRESHLAPTELKTLAVLTSCKCYTQRHESHKPHITVVCYLLLLVWMSFTIIGQPRNSVLIRRV